MSKVAFNRDQVDYLNNLLEDRRRQFLKAVKEDSFEADDKAFEALCTKLFNTNDLNIEKKSSNKSSNKSSKKSNNNSSNKSKKRVKTGYMKWLWSNIIQFS